MFRKSIFISFLIALAAALYFNPNFKTISAGIAILLFGMIFWRKGLEYLQKDHSKTS